MNAEKAPNYSAEQVAYLLENAPFDYEKVKACAADLKHQPRSIVAKLKRLENDEELNPEKRKLYNAQPAYVTKTGKDVEKKADIVAMVETALNINAESLAKAGKADLERLRDAVLALTSEADEITEVQADEITEVQAES